MKSEILPGLFVGDWSDGVAEATANPVALVLCVLESLPVPIPNVTWIPILSEGRASVSQLAKVATVIDAALTAGRPVLVHCGAGIERSPLAVAWFLHTKQGMSWDAAYARLKAQRPQVEDRRGWLPPEGLV